MAEFRKNRFERSSRGRSDSSGPRFERNSDSRGGRDRSRGGFGGGRRVSPQFTKATCAKCGAECELPFKPTTSKPVYCRDCFQKTNQDAPSSRPRVERSDALDEINRKLDKILEALDLK
ncbi:MAG: hypothetical protein HGA85_04420 [Nanoarchaeota archaeon]|nr:hypothetical protein [Nanoarchaeota archaeon]